MQLEEDEKEKLNGSIPFDVSAQKSQLAETFLSSPLDWFITPDSIDGNTDGYAN